MGKGINKTNLNNYNHNWFSYEEKTNLSKAKKKISKLIKKQKSLALPIILIAITFPILGIPGIILFRIYYWSNKKNNLIIENFIHKCKVYDKNKLTEFYLQKKQTFLNNENKKYLYIFLSLFVISIILIILLIIFYASKK